MYPSLTLAYLTCRRECRIEWWWDAVWRQVVEHNLPTPKIIVVDFYQAERTGPPWEQIRNSINARHIPPKPTVWQGPHRLTKENWFAASNQRNTALCLCDTEYLCYCDDLSIPMPQWLVNVYQATRFPGVTLGAYQKVKKLVVEAGRAISYEEFPGGRDSRWGHGSPNGAVPIGGEYMFGCSVVAPTEAYLRVGGWPEFVDGMSFEDVLMGLAMQNCGLRFQYNRNQLTIESEELHHTEPSFKRSDYGQSPHDKSHAALNMVKGGCCYFPNFYEGGIRKMREEVLAGKPFPVVQNPQHEWFTKTPLTDL